MSSEKEEKSKYFQEALGDFVHDAASGGAIRHLLDLGYTTDGILRQLDFPTPRARVEKTVYRYFLEQGILLEELPVSAKRMKTIVLTDTTGARLTACLRERIDCNGEEASYVACPYGMIRRDREVRLDKMFACLTSREREYLLGIPWQSKMMYHRLNSRMLEISVCLAVNSGVGQKFYFLKSEEILETFNKNNP